MRKARSTLELTKVGILRMRSGRMGLASRDSSSTKPASSRSDAAPKASVCTETHPYWVASMMAKTPSMRASVTITEPVTSTPLRMPSPTFSRIRARPSRKVTTPMGTLMKKIQCQDRVWVSTPPTNRPIEPPPTATKM